MTSLLAIDQQISDITHSAAYQRLMSAHRDRQQQLELDKIRLELETLRSKRALYVTEPVSAPRRMTTKPRAMPQVFRAVPTREAPEPEAKMPNFVGKRPAGLTVQKATRVTRPQAQEAAKPEPEVQETRSRPVRPTRPVVLTQAAVAARSAETPREEEPMQDVEAVQETMQEDVPVRAPTRLAPRTAAKPRRTQTVQRRATETDEELVPSMSPKRLERTDLDDFAVMTTEDDLPAMPPTMRASEEKPPKARRAKKDT